MAGERDVLRISGSDRVDFLQGLVTNDVAKTNDGLVYAGLLTPQGKYLADFFLLADGDAILLDVARNLSAALIQRLTMYKLRADVTIEKTDINVACGTGPIPAGAYADPRHPAMGWRLYGTEAAMPADYDSLRVANCIPESGIELIPNETYALEAGFERLNGVDFRKGCYVGQEVTARMKHKTELKKGLATVEIEGAAPVGTAIETDGRPAGTLFTQSGGKALAHLRFDRAQGEMTAAGVTLRLAECVAST